MILYFLSLLLYYLTVSFILQCQRTKYGKPKTTTQYQKYANLSPIVPPIQLKDDPEKQEKIRQNKVVINPYDPQYDSVHDMDKVPSLGEPLIPKPPDTKAPIQVVASDKRSTPTLESQHVTEVVRDDVRLNEKALVSSPSYTQVRTVKRTLSKEVDCSCELSKTEAVGFDID